VGLEDRAVRRELFTTPGPHSIDLRLAVGAIEVATVDG
jgi:hypothetical protein